MRFYTVFSLLFLLCGLVVLGCGDSVEESDADVLGPDEDFRFQELPVAEGGSLIPPDEVPVITIEKTREDAENIWWRLKADPAPSREDLVVFISTFPLENFGNWDVVKTQGDDYYLLSILRFKNNSVEMKSLRSQTDESLAVAPYSLMMRIVLVPVATLPAYQLDDGYVAPQGFQFSYYLPGTSSSLEIPAKE